MVLAPEHRAVHGPDKTAHMLFPFMWGSLYLASAAHLPRSLGLRWPAYTSGSPHSLVTSWIVALAPQSPTAWLHGMIQGAHTVIQLTSPCGESQKVRSSCRHFCKRKGDRKFNIVNLAAAKWWMPCGLGKMPNVMVVESQTQWNPEEAEGSSSYV